jgi:hypothetical protein
MTCKANAAAAGASLPSAQCTTSLSTAFAVSESRGGCRKRGDADDIAAVVRGAVSAIVTAVGTDLDASGCAAKKLSAATAYVTTLLDEAARFREQHKPESYRDRLDASAARLRTSYAQTEAAGGCATVGDAALVRGLCDDLVGDVIERVWPVDVLGFAFSKPPDLHLNGSLFILRNGRALSFDDFHGTYVHGGMLPPGGVALTVSTEDVVPGASLTDLVAADYADHGFDATTVVVVAGHPATRVDDHTKFPGGTSEARCNVYFKDGRRLYRIGVEYPGGDSTAEASAHAALTQVLGTFEIVQ